jgi:hypothetical protein
MKVVAVGALKACSDSRAGGTCGKVVTRGQGDYQDSKQQTKMLVRLCAEALSMLYIQCIEIIEIKNQPQLGVQLATEGRHKDLLLCKSSLHRAFCTFKTTLHSVPFLLVLLHCDQLSAFILAAIRLALIPHTAIAKSLFVVRSI